MAEWRVKLRGDQWDLDTLVSELRSPELNVIKEQDIYYLRAALFVSLNDAAEVLQEVGKSSISSLALRSFRIRASGKWKSTALIVWMTKAESTNTSSLNP